jgi:TRAP-type C4-dicarboxylate transport system permease small subunit
MRELFSTGVVWADEAVKLLVLWIAMIGSIAAARDNRHIRIDALSHFLPPGAIRVVRILVDLFAASVCVVIAWHALRYVRLEAEFGDTVLLDTPAWLVHAVVPVAFLLVAWRFLVLVLQQAYALVTRDPTELPQ